MIDLVEKCGRTYSLDEGSVLPLRQDKAQAKSDPRNNLGKDARRSCFSLSNLYQCSACKSPKHLETACRCRASTTGITPRRNPPGRNPTFANPPQISCASDARKAASDSRTPLSLAPSRVALLNGTSERRRRPRKAQRYSRVCARPGI